MLWVVELIDVKERRSILSGVFSSLNPPFPPSLYFPLFISLTGGCPLSGVWGLMAGLSGFASHRCSLHLGAGCQ